MNRRSSYRRLLGNGKAALLAAIEIYNKPRIDYRDECFVILLLNAWELITKALLSKNGHSIFYPKRRGEPYRTFSLLDAFRKAERFVPKGLVKEAVGLNLELLSTYRDNAVHFYNTPQFGSVIYALAQTSIVNLRDLLKETFKLDLAHDITWHLMPLGLHTPIDPIEYISGRTPNVKQSDAVRQFLTRIAESTQSLESRELDTSRLLTVFNVKLESVKKIGNADVLVGIQNSLDSSDGPLIVTKAIDPNVSHPLRAKDVVNAVRVLHGRAFTSYVLQAVAWKYGVKKKPNFCWQSSVANLVKYSQEVVTFINRLTEGDLELALREYKQRTTMAAAVPATAMLPLIAEPQKQMSA